MADKTEEICGEDYNTTAKELLTHFSSTVFACDISGDTRYIRCDFPQCREHAEALQGKPSWILNTLKNVRFLQSHVGKEVHHYMKEIDSGTFDQVSSRHYAESQHWIDTQQLPEGTRKVLAVFNLKDPQSQFGDWISLFFKAAFMAEGLKQNGCQVITQTFVSRHELMESIAKLKFLNKHWPTVEVVAVLSCHSSCQGQVFSCTPFSVGKQCGFEEFCSLHDFVMACQNVLKDAVEAVHISSCFTLKLDSSHVDWPVDAEWLKTKLRCTLSGSTKEVYETGSQVADLHLMLSTMLPSIAAGTCATQLREAVNRACAEGFPDLAREMGLEVLNPGSVDHRLLREGKEDQVTPPGLVMSSVRVVLLVQDEDASIPSKESDGTSNPGSYVALADAIAANLHMRKASDVKLEYTIQRMKHSETCLLNTSLKEHLRPLPCDNLKVLFIAIGPMFSRPNVELVDLINTWNNQRGGDACYGVHFQHVTAMQAYVIKNRLREIEDARGSATEPYKGLSEGHLAVTGLVDNGNGNCSVSFPVLLYMIHLAVGENGNRLAGKGIPSAVYSNKPVGHGPSFWTLEEVYMETCHVLSGLSRKCGLHLLSPASNPGRPVSMIRSCQSSDCIPTNDPKALQSNRVQEEHIWPSSGGDKLATSSVEVGCSSIITTIPSNEGASRKEANADTLEPHRKEENSLILGNEVDGSTVNSKPSFGVEGPDHATVSVDASSLERDGNRSLSSSDDKVFAVNKGESLTCDRKPSLGATGLVDYSSSSGEEGQLISDNEDEFDEEPFGVACLQKESLTMGVFLKDASFPEEDSTASKMAHNDEGLNKPSSAIVPAETDSNWPEEERSRMKLDSQGPVSLACLNAALSTVSPILEEATLPEVGPMLNPDSLHKEPVDLACFQKHLTSIKPVLQDAPLAGKESVDVISIAKDCSNITVNKKPAGLVCQGEELSTSLNLEDITLTREGENTVDLDHDGDQLDEELVGLACLKKESSTISAFLHDERSSEESVSAMQLDQGDNELDTKPVSVISDEKSSSTVSEGFSEGESSWDDDDDDDEYFVSSCNHNKVDDMEPKGSSVETSTINSSSALQYGTRTNVPFQTWLQNFKTYCKGQKRKMEREGFQDPPRKSRKKKVLKYVKKDCMSGNLERKNNCLGGTNGKGSFELVSSNETRRVYVPEMSPTTASPSSSGLNLGNASGGHVVMVSHVEGETKSHPVRTSETATETGCVYVPEMSPTTASPSTSGLNLGNASGGHVVMVSHVEGETKSHPVRTSETATETGCVYVPEMSPTTASPSTSGLNLGNASGGHMVMVSHMEGETKSHPVRTSETATESGCVYVSEMSPTTASPSTSGLNLGNASGGHMVMVSHMEGETKSHPERTSETATESGCVYVPEMSPTTASPSTSGLNLGNASGGHVVMVSHMEGETKSHPERTSETATETGCVYVSEMPPTTASPSTSGLNLGNASGGHMVMVSHMEGETKSHPVRTSETATESGCVYVPEMSPTTASPSTSGLNLGNASGGHVVMVSHMEGETKSHPERTSETATETGCVYVSEMPPTTASPSTSGLNLGNASGGHMVMVSHMEGETKSHPVRTSETATETGCVYVSEMPPTTASPSTSGLNLGNASGGHMVMVSHMEGETKSHPVRTSETATESGCVYVSEMSPTTASPSTSGLNLGNASGGHVVMVSHMEGETKSHPERTSETATETGCVYVSEMPPTTASPSTSGLNLGNASGGHVVMVSHVEGETKSHPVRTSETATETGCVYVSEMPPTTASPSTSGLNLGNASGGHMVMVSHMEGETKSHPVRTSETATESGCVYVSEMSPTTASPSTSGLNLGNASGGHVVMVSHMEGETKSHPVRTSETATESGCVYVSEMSPTTASPSTSGLNLGNASGGHMVMVSHVEGETKSHPERTSETATETGCVCVSEMSPTTASPSTSGLNLGNASGGHVVMVSHMEGETKSHPERTSETATESGCVYVSEMSPTTASPSTSGLNLGNASGGHMVMVSHVEGETKSHPERTSETATETGCVYVSEMSPTTASPSMSGLNLGNASGGHMVMVSHMEGETKSHPERTSETATESGCVYVSEMSSTTASSSVSHVNLGTTSAVQVISTTGQRERKTAYGCARNVEANQVENKSFDERVGSVYPTEISSIPASSSVSALNTDNTSNEYPPRLNQKECETLGDSVESSETAQFQETVHAYMSEVLSTNAESSVSEINVGKTSGEHNIGASHMESETESDFVRNSDVQFKNTNLFEILEATKVGHCSSPDRSCARKRPSVIDSSCDGEKCSVKKLKHECECECESNCESKCDKTVEKSLSSTSSEWDKSKDLPLMANVDEVLVKHYILDLSVKFSEKIMQGSIVLFLNPRNEEVTKRQFQMTLDSTLVNIESVSEIVLPDDFKLTFFGQEEDSGSTSGVQLNGFLGDILGDNSHNPLPFKGLQYSVYGWFVRIWKPDATGKAWPRCIWIKYHTSPEGKSLTWATDQNGKPCVYSPGAYINNRSLMPCQEPPVAMSTWQASIHVPEGCVVLMSGNELIGKTAESDGQVTYLYEMGTPLPCATLAVAVGWWECRQSRNADTANGVNLKVPVTCRLFAPPSLIDSAAGELLGYAPKFLEASCELLGPYPFRRLDMLILPKCFACMGLKSPNLVFLSQSILSGDASMRVRLAHEISHAWFGLQVGAKDWSEEWLSEGFATFVEEKIQSRAEKWSEDKDRFLREIRQILRHRCLLSEIKECDTSLKYLRPKVVKPSTALSTAEAIEKSASQPDAVRPHTVVQFGQICSRKWTQVHYLKGYFLLHHLTTIVGHEDFDSFLFNYVQHYKEQLVTSEDFFEFFLQSFPDVSRQTMEKFIHEWLERAGLPKSFQKRFDSPDNQLVSQVEDEFQIWKKQDTTNKRNKTLKVRKKPKPPTTTLEVPEQVVLFLEKLLERETLSHNTLRQLDKCYNFSNGNAEVRHRWCELVVKHKYTPGLQEVKRFLVEDQGMGIYLFGELIISEQPKQRALVDEVLEEISAEMDRCTYQTVKDMLEGNE